MKYENGKIYQIKSNIGPKVYVGSTIKAKLSYRFTSHKYHYQQWKEGNFTNITVFENI